ncbi:hypothetical protein KCU85_g28, partial [Aureobasidium melanogenum]
MMGRLVEQSVMRAYGEIQAQERHTFNKVASQDKHVLDNVGALGGRVEDAGVVVGAQNESGIAGGIGLDGLSALFLADLVYRLDLLEVLVAVSIRMTFVVGLDYLLSSPKFIRRDFPIFVCCRHS